MTRSLKIGSCFIISLLMLSTALQSQWLSGYDYRRAIIVQPNQVPNSATLADFPMLVDVTGSYLLTTGNGGDITSNNGWDIAFTMDHATTLSHDIVEYEGVTTGMFKAWVKVPSIQDGTVIYMYYGNSSVSADPSSTGTWSNNYEAVWQLDSDFEDATSNNHDGTNFGSDNSAGVINDARDFESSDANDRIDVGTFSVSGSGITISSWIYIESYSAADGRILSKANGTGANNHWYAVSARRSVFIYYLRFRLKTNGTTTDFTASSNGMIPGGWYYTTAVYDGSNMIIYLNGNQSGSTAKSGTLDVNNSISTFIGNNPNGNAAPFDGVIDQVSISSTARSADWIGAEFNNQSSPSTFYYISSASAFNAGHIIIPSGAYVSENNSFILLKGHWENNGSFTHNSGTLVFTGIDQTIDGASATQFNNITIHSGSNTAINSTNQTLRGVLLCNGTLNAGGNLTLLSTASQTALIDGNGTGTISGNINIQRYLPSGFGYHYFSSPFQAATVSEFGDDMDLGASFPTFYSYDESRTSSGWVTYTTGTNLLNPMEGYAVNFGDVPGPKTVDVTGEVNDGSMQLTLYNNNNTYTLGFNLVGNPYPSPIDWDAGSGWTKTNIDDALYFFEAGSTDQYTGTYSTYINGVSSDGIADNIISSMQGFFVHVTDGSFPVTGTLGFSNSIRTNDLSPAFFKAATVDNSPMIRINAGFNDIEAPADPVVIYFDPAAATDFEKDKDALKLMNTDARVPNFYIFTPGARKLSISGMPLPDGNIHKIPAGIRTERDGWVQFRVSNKELMPQELYTYLVDAQTGITCNLKNDAPYKVYLDAGEHNSRFYLVFSDDEWENPFGANELFTINRSGNRIWVVLNLQFGEKGILRMINMQGKVLWTEEVYGNETVYLDQQVSSGIYVISLFSDKEVYSKKLLIP